MPTPAAKKPSAPQMVKFGFRNAVQRWRSVAVAQRRWRRTRSAAEPTASNPKAEGSGTGMSCHEEMYGVPNWAEMGTNARVPDESAVTV